jgi:hypothetical protein
LKIKFSIRAKASGTFNPFLIVASIIERIMAKFYAACSPGFDKPGVLPYTFMPLSVLKKKYALF